MTYANENSPSDPHPSGADVRVMMAGFEEALESRDELREFVSTIAAMSGVPPQCIWTIRSGHQDGSRDERRQIVGILGAMCRP